MALPTEQELQAKFPSLYNAVKASPELWNVLVWGAVAGWDATEVESAIQNTNYYRTHTDAQRQWDVKLATDPTSAAQSHTLAANEAQAANLRLGAGLTWDQVVHVGRTAAENGWNAQQIGDYVVSYTKWVAQGGVPGQQVQPGEFTAAMTKVRSLANEYGVPVDPESAVSFASQFLTGAAGSTQASEQSLREKFASQAKSLYPSLAPQLEAGTTVAQWAQPYKTLAAQELEVSPDSITFNDPKWRAMLEGTKDPKTGTTTPLTLSEWQAKIRQGNIYGYDKTTGAKQQASQMETELLKRFGGV